MPPFFLRDVVGPVNLENASKAFGLEHQLFSLDCSRCLPALTSIKEDDQHVASDDINLGLDTDIGGSP